MDIVGLPALLDTTAPPAMPTGDRTIAHPRRLVNARRFNSRTLLSFLRTLISYRLIGFRSVENLGKMGDVKEGVLVD
jgi:hypothetical protein